MWMRHPHPTGLVNPPLAALNDSASFLLPVSSSMGNTL